jgi:thiamine monophosphate synthase
VHLGVGRLPATQPASVWGRHAILGATCHDSLALAAKPPAPARASYLAFGAMYVSPTKPLAHPGRIALLTDARRFGLPVVAIGGITALIMRSCDCRRGRHCVAVISDIFGCRRTTITARARGLWPVCSRTYRAKGRSCRSGFSPTTPSAPSLNLLATRQTLSGLSPTYMQEPCS